MKILAWVAVAIIGLGVYIGITSKDNPAPDSTDMVYPAPTAEMQSNVSALKTFRGKKYADVVAKFYWDFAQVLNKDTTVKTVTQFRNVHVRAQQVLVATVPEFANSLPGVSAQIDAALVQALGKEDTNLNRSKAVEVLNAIAWALGG